MKVINRFAGNEIAPAWFAGAMATALLPINARLTAMCARLDGMDARLDGIDRSIIIAEARAFNRSAHGLDEAIVAPIIPPAVAAPAGFPETILELANLSGPNCDACMNAYGLVLPAGVQNTVGNKRRLLTRFLGVRE